MKNNLSFSQFVSIFLIAVFFSYGFYLSARVILPVSNLIYQNLYLIAALLFSESVIVLKTVKLLMPVELAEKRFAYLLSVFAGLNSILASILYWRLSSDEWLASIRLNAILMPSLPYSIVVSAIVWLVVMIKEPKLQRLILPEDLVDRVLKLSREPRNELGILFWLFAVGVGLRLINIAGYPPANDEHYQLRAAFEMLNGIPVSYQRGLVNVSLPIAFSFKLCGVSLLTARLPMILLNMLAIFPLFYLTRKINQLVGFVSVILFICNPNIVALAQLARDYAVTPVFMYSILLIFSDLVLSPRFLSSDAFNTKNKLRLAGLIGILIYIFFAGQQTVLQVNLLLYVVYLLLIILAVLFGNYSYRIKIITPMIIFIALIAILLIPSRSPIHYSIAEGLMINFSATPILVIAWLPYSNWSYFLPEGSLIIMIIGAFMLASSIRGLISGAPKHRFMFMILAPFFTALFYMSFFLYNEKLGRGYRYAVFLQELFIPLSALILLKAGSWIKNRLNRQPVLQMTILTILFFVFFFNIPAYRQIANFKGDGMHPVTNINHLQFSTAVEVLSRIEQPTYMLLSDNFLSSLQLSRVDIPINRITRFNPIRKGKLTLSQAIGDHTEGWLMLTEDDAAAMGFIPDDFKILDINFRFDQKISNGILWQWQTVSSSP